MIMIKRWAIRQKSTGLYLPNTVRWRGSTHTEPGDPAENIRLFNTESGAAASLRWWLKGRTVKVWTVGYYAGSFDEVDDLDTTPAPERNADDMEVVPVVLMLPN